MVNIVKGQRVHLTKDNPNLKKLSVALGWEPKESVGGADFDPDVSAFLLNDKGVCPNDRDVVFYNMTPTPSPDGKTMLLMHYSGSVLHTGDNRTGTGASKSDKEVIQVDLAKVPATYTRIAFVVTIYEAVPRNQNLGMMRDAFIRVVDADTGVEILRYNLTEDFSTQTAVIIGEVYRDGSNWKFAAVGDGLNGGLEAVITKYGLSVT